MNVVFVFILWLHVLNGNHVEVNSVSLVGTTEQPADCAQIDLGDAVKRDNNGAAKLKAGLIPKVVCGIAAPEDSHSDVKPQADKPHEYEPSAPSNEWQHPGQKTET